MLQDCFVPEGQRFLLEGGEEEMLACSYDGPPPPPPPEGVPARRLGRADAASNPQDGGSTPRDERQPTGLAAAPAAAAESRAESNRLWWLGLLFVETLALLVFQVGLGLLAHSLALLADSGHSAADVIGYGINYFAERWKLRAATVELQGLRSDRDSAAAAVKMDLMGSIVSTILLCAATSSGAFEAYHLLNSAPEGKAVHHVKGHSGIGRALLAFSVVSTVANVGTLLIYRRWCGRSAAAPAAKEDPSSLEMGKFTPPTLPPAALEVEELPPVPAATSSRPPRRDRARGKGSLNISASYSAAAEQACVDPACNDSTCVGGGEGCDDCCSGAGWAAILHAIVHPGCSGDHTAGSGEKTASEKKATNFNVTAAMLHLVADCLRGVVILITALIIQAGAVSDPERADAVCALLVAVFVALGSVALIYRMLLALRKELPDWFWPSSRSIF